MSKKEDPRLPSDWWRWSVIPGGDQTSYRPKIGFSDKWIAVELDKVVGDPQAEIFVFDKASLLAGNAPTGSGSGQNYKKLTGSPNQGLFMCPVRTYDPNVSDLFLLQSAKLIDTDGTNDRLTYYKIYGDTVANVQMSAGTDVIADPTLWYNPWHVVPWNAPQLGDSSEI